MTKAKEEFWDRLEDVQAGMLGVASDGRLVPMSPNLYEDGEDGVIWFITAQGTDLVDALASGGQAGRFVVADPKEGLYANIDGQMSLSDDKKVLDEIWSAMAAVWFDEGKQDPDLRLIRFVPSHASAWFSTTSAAKFIYEIAKASMTDEMPDTGWKAEISF